jgi:hypothetical protein
MGFINAAALIIALSQLPALMGISVRQSQHLLLDTWSVLSRPDLLHEMSLAFGVAAIVLLLLFGRFAPRRCRLARRPYANGSGTPWSGRRSSGRLRPGRAWRATRRRRRRRRSCRTCVR